MTLGLIRHPNPGQIVDLKNNSLHRVQDRKAGPFGFVVFKDSVGFSGAISRRLAAKKQLSFLAATTAHSIQYVQRSCPLQRLPKHLMV